MVAQQKPPPAMAEVGVYRQFPEELKVLVVDDDLTCLKIVEQMLKQCRYLVTSCSQATVALNLLREKKGYFDLVLSDVHMPDMDGFKLLELVGLEMDLPVIMMSADKRTDAVMMGVKHGACDYLIKPIREEELKNIWQHVVRKKRNENKEHELVCSLDDIERQKRGSDDSEYLSSFNGEGAEGLPQTQKKKRDDKEDDVDTENADPTTAKKPRVVWSIELHQQFVSAVNHLGIDKAVPKRILELMNVPGLTRENVASHLQKFRLYLKRLSTVSPQQGGISSPYCGPIEPNVKVASYGGFSFPALASSGQMPPQTLAALHAELLGRPTGTLILPGTDQSLPGSLHGTKPISVGHAVSYVQPLMRCPSNISELFPQDIVTAADIHLRALLSSGVTAVGLNNLGAMVGQNDNVFNGMLHLQQQHQQQRQQQQSTPRESNRTINVQPSCLVVPSQSSLSFQAGKDLASVNQNFNFNRLSTVNNSHLSSQTSSSLLGAGQILDGASKTRSLISGHSGPGLIPSSASSCSMNPDSSNDRQLENSNHAFSAARQLPVLPPNIGNIKDFNSINVDQVPPRNLGFIGKRTSIPSRFAVDESELQMHNHNFVKAYMDNGNKVKQEPSINFVESSKVRISILQ